MAILIPKDETELAAMLQDARAPLRIRGGGTRDIGRPAAGEVLSTAALTGITLYEPGALTLVVRAGTPLAEVEAALAAAGQRLAFEPMDHRVLLGTTGAPTIGGVVAANASGPRRVQGGAARDHLIGVRFVDGTGTLIRNGGRVMKNVTGYDLVKLMAGSWGTLGVLTELSFKLQARPEAEATVIIAGLDAAAGVARLTAALGSPYDVSGAAHVPVGLRGDVSETCIRVEGMAGSVTYRADALRKLLGAGVIVTGSESADRWLAIRDVAPFADRAGALWRVSVRPTDGPVVTAALSVAGLDPLALYDWGGGLVWMLDASEGGADVIRSTTQALGGHATLIRGSQRLRAAVPAFHPAAPAIAAINARLRARFDPRRILNPGLMD